MKFIALDVETTGLLPAYHQVIEFSAIIFDTGKYPTKTLPSFQRRICWENLYLGAWNYMDPNCQRILREIFEDTSSVRVVKPDTLWIDFASWLYNHIEGKATVCGKNPAGFDLPFLCSNFRDFRQQWHRHRVLDPGMSYWKQEDDCVPDLATCISRSELFKDELTPLALHDSWNDAYATGCLTWEALNRTYSAERTS